MPSNNSVMVRMPIELHDRLVRLAADYQAAYEKTGNVKIYLNESRTPTPHVPLYAVIEKALDELESHRSRSATPKKKK